MREVKWWRAVEEGVEGEEVSFEEDWRKEKVAPASTAKLILADGELVEFDHAVKVSAILDKNSDCFICDADDMEFDGFVTAVRSDGELNPGQIYFGEIDG
ncbi:uncharacterized protein A4U43_C07F30980 [Asparagus officinalis]|uniref:Uncharacterized protein n=1 Tax=Asparagus officinalis TaxID=4686 RepID=A0A5P1EJW2_ASPOF|nr:uncharacterized protein A4U43_C07F30980 [Asparagus officinalis]